MSTEHILDAIDGALAWDGESDEMRWIPPEQEPPVAPKPPHALRRRAVRVTVIVEEGDEVTTLEVRNPLDAEYSIDVREPPQRWQSLGHPDEPSRARTDIGLKVHVDPDEGFTTHQGREHVEAVLRRIAGEEWP